MIKVNNSAGDYYLVQDGETSNTDVKVPGVDIDMTDGFSKVEQTFNIPGGTGSDNPKDVEFKDNIAVNVNENGITSDIKSISNAETSCRNTYLVFSKNTNQIKAVLENGYTIESTGKRLYHRVSKLYYSKIRKCRLDCRRKHPEAY